MLGVNVHSREGCWGSCAQPSHRCASHSDLELEPETKVKGEADDRMLLRAWVASSCRSINVWFMTSYGTCTRNFVWYAVGSSCHAFDLLACTVFAVTAACEEAEFPYSKRKYRNLGSNSRDLRYRLSSPVTGKADDTLLGKSQWMAVEPVETNHTA